MDTETFYTGIVKLEYFNFSKLLPENLLDTGRKNCIAVTPFMRQKLLTLILFYCVIIIIPNLLTLNVFLTENLSIL